ncbi:3-oxo-Delta(4,5)-steroid 5-beta-reductase [Dichanthelium oligosanthes]|uniref:3-oxo-Delta(4,5)-steroid 5-beta-reductase n=1 Tax=Dichanthelium oligosanthes TaxID=888268 RepID=A0A1E5VKZ7_9POAL|nr:3-oxo-Delta(4,5)-steroid 5-beta-reductase [Dichanthelium oligosanthes]
MSMSWWWAGAIGAVSKRQDDHAAVSPSQHGFQSVAVVVGSTGIVGTSLVDILPLPDTPGGPWKVYALSRRPLPPWSLASSPSSVTHIHVDLTDSAAATEALTPLTDITHVFYVAWTWRATEEENCEANSAMLRNVLSVVVPNCPSLVHVTLQTGTRHYFGRYSENPVHDTPYTEDMPRLDMPVFYYDQEDVLFDAVERRGKTVSWSVHRPNIIFGFSPRCAINLVCSLCVYAAICRKEGAPLRWPGSCGGWEGFITPSDADLVAEHHIWAGVEPMAKNEAFNCSNGDVCTWKKLWPILAGRFGLEWAGYEGEENRFKLTEAMAGKEELWAEIVEENELVATHVSEVANWWVIETSADQYGLNSPILDSMNKSKEHGFLGFRNTFKSFNACIDRLKAHRIVP